MFEWLKNYLLLQEMKSGSKTERQLMSWDKVKSVVVVVDSLNYELIKDFVKQIEKSVDVIVIHSDKVSQSKDSFLSFNKRDLNFFGLPNQEAIRRVRQKSYDVLINYDFNNSGFLKALTGLTLAKCKVGQEDAFYNAFFDISIKSERGDFLKQALKYLMMIKS